MTPLYTYICQNHYNLTSIALSFYRFQNVLCSPKFLSQTKNLIAFSHSSKSFVPAQKLNLVNENHLLLWHKTFVINWHNMYINFWSGTKIRTSPKYFGTCICRTFCRMIRLSSCLLSNARFVTSVGDQKPNEN